MLRGRRRIRLLVVSSVVAFAAACGRVEPSPDPEIARLVERLRGSDPEDVDAAARRLVQIGAPALEAL